MLAIKPKFWPFSLILPPDKRSYPLDSDIAETDSLDFDSYLNYILHQWLRTLAMLGYTLVPLFFVLDVFTAPRDLIYRFGMYRLVSVAVVIAQYFLIRFTRPGRFSFLHGYFISVNVAGIITIMTVDLGGFDSGYYAGLILVMVAINLLLPWKPIHSAINGSIIIFLYVINNALFGAAFKTVNLISHIFFMFGTAVISVSINYVKNKLEEKEYHLRAELKKTRDALWGEMEIAQRIQTALLPRKKELGCASSDTVGCYEIAATMLPAEQVGGDYYDIIETARGERWIAIGDVTGHGVESGLIMMMTQTSIFTIVSNTSGYKPSVVLNSVNHVIKENIARLGTDRYVAASLIRLDNSTMTVAGKHQDILVYRSTRREVEVIPTEGTWLGIEDRIKKYTTDTSIHVDIGDIILLFTDGITEATDKNGLMFGQERLAHAFEKYAALPVGEILSNIVNDVTIFWDKQHDDVTALVLRRGT